MTVRTTLASLTVRFAVAVGLAFAFFVLPLNTYAADLHSLQSVDVGGVHIVDGQTVTRDSILALSNFWTLHFTWPNFVNNSTSALMVIRGSFGHVDGGTFHNTVNFYYQSQAWAAGQNDIQKQFALPPLGSLTATSSPYTVVVAEIPDAGTFNNFESWFESGGTSGAPPDMYSLLSFNYDATSQSVELPDALHSVTIAGREIHTGDEVFRKELQALNGSTDRFWTFNFDWPNFVQNQAASLMVFRGTFGNVEGGAPVYGVNYAEQAQAWAAGHNEFNKFIFMPFLQDSATTPHTYTVMIAEADPKYLGDPSLSPTQWFATGGTAGAPPLKYSFLTFEFKGDEPYPVIIVPGILGSAERHGEWVIDPITHIYDNLIDTMDANGYTREQDLFTFPYDWRRSNVDTALLLRDKINGVQGICHCRKVDLVAHSMGGLVSRQYIQSGNYEGDVDHMIFLGTPHLGAPKDYLMWEAGVTGDDFDLSAILLKLFLSTEAVEKGYANLFEYIHDKPIPSVQELLPIYSYLFNADNSLRIYPLNYPTNTFLESLRQSFASVQNNVGSVVNIIGDDGKFDTITSLDVKDSSLLPLWPDGMPVGLLMPTLPLGTSLGSGDQTVPLVSAIGQFAASTQVMTTHTALPTSQEALVYEILTNRPTPTLVSRALIERLLVFRIFSPADLTITDPEGRRIGRDGAHEVNEIPGAFYTGFDTDTEFVVIPDPADGEYHIQALGTGAGGGYTVSTNYITDSGSVQKDASGTIAPNESAEVVATLIASSPDPLVIVGDDVTPPVVTLNGPASITLETAASYVEQGAAAIDDVDGAVSVVVGGVVDTTHVGTYEVTYDATDVAGNHATQVTRSVLVQDTVPPAIMISSPQAQNYLHSDTMSVQVAVTDAGTGVASKMNFMDGVSTSTSALDLFFLSLGSHVFRVDAQDIVGNATTSARTFNIITTPESTILDVNRASLLGWILKVSVRDSLISKINTAIRIEKKIVMLTEQLPGKPVVVKRVEKLQSRLDKVLGVNVLKELDAQLAKGNITQQGYATIKADIQWLLNQP